MDRRKFITNAAVALASAAVAKVSGVADVLSGTSKKNKTMKIVVLTGSPRRGGNSAYLAEQFIKGARESGHDTYRYDCAFRQVEPCRACNRCGMDGPCVIKDDFDELRPRLVEADMVVFATPMYYFGMSVQMKRVIDRFYAINGQIHVPKKAVLMMTYADNSKKKENAIISHYEVLLDYLGWSDAGQIIAPGVWPVGAINHTKFPEQAYRLGKNV